MAVTKSTGIGTNNASFLRFGGATTNGERTTFPIVNAHGLRFALGTSMAVGPSASNGQITVRLPPASTTPTLPSFQTLVFAEVFSQAVTGVSGSNRIFPRGFVQNQSSSFSGVTLSNANCPASFSAFGKWDVDNGTAYAGRSLAYSTASRQQLLDLLDDPETAETLWWDGDVLVQDLIRFRVVPGLGNNWLIVDPALGQPRYTSTGFPFAQGQNDTIASDYTTNNNLSYPTRPAFSDLGTISTGNFTYPGTGTYYIPILLWQQGNTGAYHPEFNPSGFGKILNLDGTTPAFWYETDRPITSRADCFTFVVGGNSASGISGHPQGRYHDFRYPDQLVRDLRYNANKVVDVQRETEKTVTNFLNSTYSNIQVKGERPGNLRLIATTTLASPPRINVALGNIGVRDRGSILIGAAGGVYRTVGSDSVNQVSVVRVSDGVAPDQTELNDNFSGQTVIWYRKDTSTTYSTHSAGGPMLWCDIIGDPANYPDWLTGKLAGDLAFQGVPCVVDVNDPTYARQFPVDVTPAGSPQFKSFRTTRKHNGMSLVVAFDGINYTVLPNSATNGGYTQTLNSSLVTFLSTDWIGGGAFDDNTVFFVFYTTEANPTNVAGLAPIFQGPANVDATNVDTYAAAISHITGRIGTHSSDSQTYTSGIVNLSLKRNNSTLEQDLPITHDAFSNEIQDISPGVKFAVAPRSNSGRMAVQMYFQELLRDPIDGNYADDGEIVPTGSLSTKIGAGASALTLQEGTVEVITNRLTSEH